MPWATWTKSLLLSLLLWPIFQSVRRGNWPGCSSWQHHGLTEVQSPHLTEEGTGAWCSETRHKPTPSSPGFIRGIRGSQGAQKWLSFPQPAFGEMLRADTGRAAGPSRPPWASLGGQSPDQERRAFWQARRAPSCRQIGFHWPGKVSNTRNQRGLLKGEWEDRQGTGPKDPGGSFGLGGSMPGISVGGGSVSQHHKARERAEETFTA